MSVIAEKTAAQVALEDLACQIDQRDRDQFYRYIEAHVDARALQQEGKSAILQDAWKSVIEIDAVRNDPEKLLPCLWTCVKRKCLNANRRYGTLKRDVNRKVSIDALTGGDGLPSQGRSPEDIAIDNERWARLSPEESEALRMKMDGDTYEEIGRQLGCKREKARQLTNRAFRRWVA